MAVGIRLKPGIVDRLRVSRGIASEEAFARLVGCHRTTLRRIAAGDQPGPDFMANLCDAFGMGLGEAFDIVHISGVAQPAEPQAADVETRAADAEPEMVGA